jgi:hypothetical protein
MTKLRDYAFSIVASITGWNGDNAIIDQVEDRLLRLRNEAIEDAVSIVRGYGSVFAKNGYLTNSKTPLQTIETIARSIENLQQ